VDVHDVVNVFDSSSLVLESFS